MVPTSSAAPSLERSVSQKSTTSVRSYRSSTLRAKPRKASRACSSASSAADSDKSLTSFPSFSPESPSTARPGNSEPRGGSPCGESAAMSSARGLVDDLVVEASPHRSRGALFEDAPISSRNVPGALHLADDAHVERLIARHGPLNLVRQMAADLAQRDAQITAIRRRADNRERALRKIALESGLSNMELETRLRNVEAEMRVDGNAQSVAGGGGLSDLMNDAMQENNTYGEPGADATIRASSVSLANREAPSKSTVKGWKEFFWGPGNKQNSGASSVSGDARPRVGRVSSGLESRRTPLQEDLFSPPDAESVASSRASSVAPQTGDRKASTSLASLALRLVAGGSIAARDGGGSERGRSSSAEGGPNPDTSRTPSMASGRTTQSARTVSTQGGPRSLMSIRRNTNVPSAAAVARTQQQDRREGVIGSPPSGKSVDAGQESNGPVEMDTIFSPEDQPPTLTQTYNNYGAPEYLTDRFGFIYDQRRKKRQREATQMGHYLKNSRAETLANGRSDAPVADEQQLSPTSSRSDSRPDTPTSLEEREGDKPKRWQDYLKTATSATELLAHMPAIGMPSVEVMEGAEVMATPPTLTPGDRGFVPTAKSTSAVDNDTSTTPEPDPSAATLVKEDTEPVKLLLQQLNDVHDSLQRDKTVRWNDFLRKVRAERRREGEAAAAAAAAAASARFERPAVILPEAKLADGEMIGISGLGNKGKVGRAKWNEFKALLLGGIPVAYRNKIWSECSGASAMRVPGYYEDLVSRPGTDDDPAVVAQIEMDIHRTLTDNIFFRRGPGVARLKEVLLAYARRNAEVGYCQGMNLITANLLLIMPSAEDAFWILASVVEKILPRGYYDHSLLASRADQVVLRRYVADVLPRLSAHLEALGVELEALTFQWFLSVFTDCLSAEALFRVWDVVLCTNDGSTFLFQVALALLKLNEAELLRCGGSAAVYSYINHQMTNHAISIDGLVQGSEALRRVVKREEVEERRGEAVKGEVEVMREREAARAGGRREGGDGESVGGTVGSGAEAGSGGT